MSLVFGRDNWVVYIVYDVWGVFYISFYNGVNVIGWYEIFFVLLLIIF